MSPGKKDHTLPYEKAARFERELTARITRILRQEYENIPTAVKRISKQTDIAPNTIKKWYGGRNPPRSGHLLILARHYKPVLELILELSGNDYLLPHIQSPPQMDFLSFCGNKTSSGSVKNDPINEPVNQSSGLNGRQRWFLEALGHDLSITAESLAAQGRVSRVTAKRDIAVLKRRGLINFIGARKNGRYVLIHRPAD